MSLIESERELSRRAFYRFAKLAWEHAGEPEYRDNWHVRLYCNRLEKVYRKEIMDLVVNIPPGFAKSMISGVLWPAWVWGPAGDPSHRFLYASFDDSLMLRDAERLQTLLRSEWYVKRWGELLPTGAQALSQLFTKARGLRFSTSFGGKGTGWHFDTEVFDDPLKPRDAHGGGSVSGKAMEAAVQTIRHTFASRARVPGSMRRVLVMQRIHEQDPSGWAIGQDWQTLILPQRYDPSRADPEDPRTTEGELLFPARMGEAAAQKLERDMGPSVWAAQEQQNPERPGGRIFDPEWLRASIIRATPEQVQGRAAQSWDLTFKGKDTSDHVAGAWVASTHVQPWNGKAWPDGLQHYIILDVWEGIATFTESIGLIRTLRRKWEAGEILIEDKANGPAAEDTLKGEMPGVIKLVNPQGGKIVRAQAVAPLLMTGRVHFLEAAWNASTLDTLGKFPAVKKDDIVDAITQAILYLRGGGSFVEKMNRIQNASY